MLPLRHRLFICRCHAAMIRASYASAHARYAARRTRFAIIMLVTLDAAVFRLIAFFRCHFRYAASLPRLLIATHARQHTYAYSCRRRCFRLRLFHAERFRRCRFAIFHVCYSAAMLPPLLSMPPADFSLTLLSCFSATLFRRLRFNVRYAIAITIAAAC